MSKLLVLYVFHKYNERVKHFIEHCIFFDENIDFIMISNNKDCELSVPDYVKTLFRDNIGWDFGGWSEGLLKDNLYENYDNFIFVNSSVVGPFLPPDYKNKWTDIYLNGLQGNVKLFGSTINTRYSITHCPHVQSYIFSMNKTTLSYLLKCEIFSITKYSTTYMSAVKREVGMSKKIIENNWNIGCLLNCYKNVDFRLSKDKLRESKVPLHSDIMFGNYKGKYWELDELIFVKGNRKGLDMVHLNLL